MYRPMIASSRARNRAKASPPCPRSRRVHPHCYRWLYRGRCRISSLFRRNFHDGHDRTLIRVVDVDHLPDARRVRLDDIVAKQDGKGLVIDEIARHEDGMTKAKRLLLPHVGEMTMSETARTRLS